MLVVVVMVFVCPLVHTPPVQMSGPQVLVVAVWSMVSWSEQVSVVFGIHSHGVVQWFGVALLLHPLVQVSVSESPFVCPALHSPPLQFEGPQVCLVYVVRLFPKQYAAKISFSPHLQRGAQVPLVQD